ncbi:hypothetical protein SAMN05216428_11296 [Nitrosospira sp. Nsp11]|uniref:hypothetical protein n=1 Tax=Nitrosospira sp. Nsp11 TaxID=1855338 RepID=UPI0009129645|nr:hypothetical protein [Nitrosospira sp. Nsp11]SHM05668.1 hypothetical protein SAMN05216428_11296 [Nitrosospira sp. Nsp11]
MVTLTTEQKAILNGEIDLDPKSKGYASRLANQPGHAVDLFNGYTELMHKERLITNLTLPSILGTSLARSIRTKLEALAPTDIVIADFVHAMGSQPGGNIGDPKAVEMIGILRTIGENGFTSEEADALVALSLLPASRAEVLGLPYMTEEILRDR